MNHEAATVQQHGNAYNIFILVLTIMSLAIMGLLLLPLDEDTEQLLRVYDNLICVVFLIDFAVNLRSSRPRSNYFIGQRGWLDLLGSIPSFGGAFRFAALFRLARLSRLSRIMRLLRGDSKKELIADVLKNRGQYAMFITLLMVLLVLSVSSVLMIQFEGRSPDANIQTGGDALWWAMVTITTVGYGDRFPVTELGRIVAMSVMFAGIGIIGALASILASILVAPSAPAEEPVTSTTGAPDTEPAPGSQGSVAAMRAGGGPPADVGIPTSDLAAIRSELAALRVAVAALSASLPADAGRPPKDDAP